MDKKDGEKEKKGVKGLRDSLFCINKEKEEQINMLRESSLSYFVKEFAVLEHEIDFKNQADDYEYEK